MKKELSILIYEKDKIINSILLEQLINTYNYEICVIDNSIKLFSILSINSFDACIINLNGFEKHISNFIKVFNDKNNHNNIIFYDDKELENKNLLDSNIFYLKIPFKLNTLFDYLKDILNNKENNKTKIYLMKNLVFLPDKKIIQNNQTDKKEHLTEKENDLLKYLFKNKNSKILKKNLLISIWGINENINTHTLETHLYRLKQKLYKLEPKLTFSLINQNGIYFFKNHD